MKILKPTWVSHEGKPIFSIDIHPDGSRFATGGQGDSSGKIVIWSMEPVRDEVMEKNKSVPRLLCQIDSHLGCVNCVRWSHDGKYLASASDDKLVMIWQYRSGTSSSVFGSGGKFENLEAWKSKATLRGHGGDVLHVAWSEGDTWLASCSVDNTIIIWNSLKLPEQISTLRGHTGLIKGLSWDPISKFLASQSDDKTIRIWRTYDWQQETCIKEPFKECGGTTHILRLDWSPDGQYLVSAHSMNNSGPTAKIINRISWNANMDFVGHRKAVTCVRFNPRIMKPFMKTEGENYMCCAIGSKDRSVSIWSAALKKRPIVVMHDLFENSVLDISWSSDGLELLACSWDGSVAYFSFDPKELGQPQNQDIKIAMLENLYGKIQSEVSTSKDDILIESVHVLSTIYESKSQQNSSFHDSNSNMNPPLLYPSNSLMSSENSNKGVSKQIECRTTDGRRRITPIFIEPQFSSSEGPRPHRSMANPTFSSTIECSNIIVEKSSHIHIPSDTSRDASKDFDVLKNNAITTSNEFNTSIKLTNIGVTVSIKSPTLNSINNSITTLSTADVNGITLVGKSIVPEISSPKKITESASLESLKIKKEEPKFTSLKKPIDASQSEDEPIRKKDGRGRPPKRNVIDSPTITQNIPPTLIIQSSPKKINKDKRDIHNIFGQNDILPSLSIATTFSTQFLDINGSAICYEIHNSPNINMLHSLRCISQENKILWQTVFNSKIAALTATKIFVSVVCEDRLLYIYSAFSGRYLFSPIGLDSKIAYLQSNNEFLMVITSMANIFLWNIQNLRIVIKNESILPLYKNNDSKILNCQITDNGLPIVNFNDGSNFIFNKEMEIWTEISSLNDSIAFIASHRSKLTNGLLSSLQSKQAPSRENQVELGRILRTDPVTRTIANVTFLERQLASCIALSTVKEYKHWLHVYVQHLVDTGDENKVRDILQDLLSCNVDACDTSKPAYLKNISFDGVKFVRELLPLVRKNLSLQRLFCDFQFQLQHIDDNLN